MLLAVAFIWGSAFVAQRIAGAFVGPFLVNSFRYLIGAIIVFPFSLHHWKIEKGSVMKIILTGFILFAGSSLQQIGLKYTLASNASFITALYVILVPIFGVIAFRMRIAWWVWLSALAAVFGAFLLGWSGPISLHIGDGIIFLGAIFWAVHVMLVGSLVKKVNPFLIAFGQFQICGILSLVMGGYFDWSTISGLSQCWWAVLYLGLFSTGMGFTLQIIGQKNTSPSEAALILSMEAVFGALFGWAILDENMPAIKLVGCIIIFMALVISQIFGKINQQKP